nr:VOC family protein [Brachyspira hyodysenteriae]
MLKEVMHIGITVSNIERSINFYRDVLGLKLIGEALMEGKETDALFAMNDCKVKLLILTAAII